MSVPEYERIYGVALLDDVHNFFPELLYNPARFDSIAHVFLYVQRQMNARFNLFHHGRSRYFANRYGIPTYVQPAVHPFHVPVAPAPAPQPQAPMEDPLTPALLSLLIRSFPPVVPRQQDDVVVRPTPQQIQQASVVIQGSSIPQYTHAPEPYSCAICQDSITGADTCRLLRTCEHVFHTTCIDPWFQRNVRCPVCRHDIRTYVAPTTPIVQPPPSVQSPHSPHSSHSPHVHQ